MSNAVTSAPAILPSPVGALPCERCGTFLSGAPVKVWAQRVCESCASLLRKETRLYPYWYIIVLGILGNFLCAAVLSALNWKRLGDRARMRNAIIMAVLAAGWMVFMLVKDFRGASFVNLIGSLVASQGLKEVWEEHKTAGGARAGLLWPLLIGVSGSLGFAILVSAGLALAGIDS